jgi:hypothetical protein
VVGGIINFKLQGLEVFHGVRTALDFGHVDLKIVRLNYHQRIGRSRQARYPQQSQKPVRSVYQAINNGPRCSPSSVTCMQDIA